jgi:hypothetical protein
LTGEEQEMQGNDVFLPFFGVFGHITYDFFYARLKEIFFLGPVCAQ